MTISLDKLAELAAAPCTQPWWNEAELREGVRHFDGEATYLAACDPGTVLKLLAVVKAAKDFSPMLGMIVYHNQPALIDALAALDAP